MNTQINLLQATGKTGEGLLTAINGELVSMETHHEKTFTSADLWNIQRQKKMIVRRRYLG